MYIRRKVFSNVEQPVEEQFYSVTMTEEEYNLFSEFLEEREYACSVRKVKKITNAAVEAALKRDKKAMGKVMARAGRQGLSVNSIKKINNPNYDKVVKSQLNNLEKKTGVKLDIDKDLAISKAKEIGTEMAKQNIARGGKPLMKLKDIPV